MTEAAAKAGGRKSKSPGGRTNESMLEDRVSELMVVERKDCERFMAIKRVEQAMTRAARVHVDTEKIRQRKTRLDLT